MTATTRCSLLRAASLGPIIASLVLVHGCADGAEEPSLDAVDNAVQIELPFRTSASSVYLGERMLLTNWHVCEAGRTRENRAVLFHAATSDQPVYVEFPPVDEVDDIRLGEQDLRSAPFPIIEFGFMHFPYEPEIRHSLKTEYGAKVLFTQKDLDLCIVELEDEPVRVPPLLTIDTHEVQLGQEVVAAGYPLGVRHVVAERCRVTATPKLIRDPDLVSPSDTSVRSFAVDCKTTQHGSSGSPIFDATTGALLGLLWTGECTEGIGKCEPPAYVSAASEWLTQGDRPPSQYMHLQDLLARFAGP